MKETREKRSDPPESDATPSYRLLIIEDNPSTLKLLQLIFEGEAHEIDTARSVDEALFKAEEHTYDAFVVDINLGERRTGIEVLHELRRMPQHEDVPAVACTAYALHDHVELFREAGFADVITKPIKKRDLLASIQKAIEDPAPPPALGKALYKDLTLPPLPTAVSELLRLVSRSGHDEADYEDLIRIFTHDQVLSTWLIRRANSAFFKFNTDIESVEQAIQHLGFRPACNLLLGKLLTDRFAGLDTSRERQVYDYVMRLGLGAAHLARSLAEHLDHPRPDIAYSGVLLSQLGRLLLLDSHGDDYARLWFDGDAFDGPPPIGQEMLALSASYVTMGVEVGHHSKFSDTLLRVIRYHRRPGDAPKEKEKPLIYLVATAVETYASMIDKPKSELLPVLLNSGPLEGTVDRTGADRRDLMTAIQEMLERARAFADEALRDDGG